MTVIPTSPGSSGSPNPPAGGLRPHLPRARVPRQKPLPPPSPPPRQVRHRRPAASANSCSVRPIAIAAKSVSGRPPGCRSRQMPSVLQRFVPARVPAIQYRINRVIVVGMTHSGCALCAVVQILRRHPAAAVDVARQRRSWSNVRGCPARSERASLAKFASALKQQMFELVDRVPSTVPPRGAPAASRADRAVVCAPASALADPRGTTGPSGTRGPRTRSAGRTPLGHQRGLRPGHWHRRPSSRGRRRGRLGLVAVVQVVGETMRDRNRSCLSRACV